jgi:nitroreductase
MEALAAITARHSTRNFKSDPIPRPIVEKIAEAGHLAATARNDQPWEFVAVTDSALRRQIAELADYGKFIAEAPVCLCVFCKAATYYIEDGSAAAQNMLVAAAALGVQSCWVAGDKKEYAPKVAALLGAPPEHKLVALLAMGYESGSVPRRPKRTLAQMLHWEKF